MALRYTTKELVEAFLKRSLTGDELLLLPLIGAAAENEIDATLDSSFGNVSETTRYFDGGSAILDTGPVRNITAVSIVDSEETVTSTYVLNDDFEARPRNGTVKRYIQKRLGCFPRGLGNIAVTGKFTFSEDDEIPDDIKYVATYMVVKMFQRPATGELKSESIEGYSRVFKDYVARDEIVSSILNRYGANDVLL